MSFPVSTSFLLNEASRAGFEAVAAKKWFCAAAVNGSSATTAAIARI